MNAEKPQFLTVGEGADSRRLAYLTSPPAAAQPGLFWLPGFLSDMESTKATALAAWARTQGFGMTRFDYSGHGRSEGRFEEGTFGQWLDDATEAFRHVTRGGQVVVGSSMGGYLAILLLMRLRERYPKDEKRVRGVVAIAPAWQLPLLIWDAISSAQKEEVMQQGLIYLPSAYGDPLPISRRLIEEGRSHVIWEGGFDPGRPVRILHGRLDQDVPLSCSQHLMSFLSGGWASFAEIPDGDHRLSRPQDLDRLFAAVAEMARGGQSGSPAPREPEQNLNSLVRICK